MRDYNVYLAGMHAGLQEKLFFLEKLNMQDFDTIVDFGCGGGEILAACAAVTNARLIGIDYDEFMRDETHKRVPTAELYSELTRDMLSPRTLLIFSSVLHEVEAYWITLEQLIQGTGCTIVVRDMRFSTQPEPIDKDDLAKLVFNSDSKRLGYFIHRCGMKDDRDMYHYLLKYSYVDNWILEREENYFSFDYDRLFKLGAVLYERNYLLEYKRDRVIEDFNIFLTKPTHTMIILKVREE